MTTDASKGASDEAGQGMRLIRWFVGINLGLVALQALSAGFLMSGYARALTVHEIGTVAVWRTHTPSAEAASMGVDRMLDDGRKPL